MTQEMDSGMLDDSLGGTKNPQQKALSDFTCTNEPSPLVDGETQKPAGASDPLAKMNNKLLKSSETHSTSPFVDQG